VPKRELLVRAVVEGLVLEGIVALLAYLVPAAAWFLTPVGLFVVAVRLGLRYGRVGGVIGAVAPLVILWGAEAVRRSIVSVAPEQAQSQTSLPELAVAVVAAGLIVGFVAFLAGALIERYART
jgi:hypothetical protein